MRFVAHPCREEGGVESFTVYKDGFPYIRPASGQIITRQFASMLVKTCNEYFNAEAGAKREAEAGRRGPEPSPPTGAVA